MPRLTPSASEPLADALSRYFLNFGLDASVQERSSRGWASISVQGERHRLTMRIEGDEAEAAADAFAAALPDREFQLPGHIVADIIVAGEERDPGRVVLVLEALTVVEG